MKRPVIDPGVLVSALISPRRSAPSTILEAILDREFTPLTCLAFTAELTDVLAREKFARYTTPVAAKEYIDSISQCAEHHDDPPIAEHRTADADDDYLLALAHEHDADAIISGDKHLLDAADEHMPALTPRELVDELKLEDSDAGPPAAVQEPAPA